MNRRTFLNTTAAGSALGIVGNFSVAHAFSPLVAEASVIIHPNREVGRVDKKLYGHFLEHVENVVYGGVYDPGSPLSDEMGLRLDVIEAIREMGGAHVIRWPGGNFVSYYHWQDGIGPKEKRPKRFDVVWSNYESNHFGTDEYLALCQKLGCEPFITANMGNGSLEEACHWVEYCRKANRQPPVKIWGLGNEHFGPWQVGYYTAEEYGRKAQQFGQFMRSVEKDLQFVGVGFTEPEWNETVLKHCGSLLDWLTIHIYGHRTSGTPQQDFDMVTATPYFFEQKIREMANVIERYEQNNPVKKPIEICLEEWNLRHQRNNQLWRESPRNNLDALFVAAVFNMCQRQAARVTMTNYVFLLNAHAPIVVLKDGVLKSATFDVFRLYATTMQPVAIHADVVASSFTANISMPPAWNTGTPTVTAKRLDVSATRSADGKKLTVSLLNLDQTQPVRVKLDVTGRKLQPGGTLHTIYSKDIAACNTVQEPDKVRSASKNLKGIVDLVELPPHSVNLLELALDR